MRNILLAAIAAALLSAPAAAAVPAAEGFSDRLARLPELQRFAALRSVLANSNEVCRRVESAERHGSLRNLAMWTVRCTPTGEFGVFIGPDGSAQVRTCGDLAKLKLPACAPRPAPATTARVAPRRPR